jgi:uncharacterized protein (DUF1501 family)
MQRRKFLKNTLPAGIMLPGILNSYSVKALGMDNPLVQALGGNLPVNDHVLVLVQLNGGNDGLNTIIPLDIYSNYYNARTNVAIEESKILKFDDYSKSGIHPAMSGMHNMYKDGKLAVVQAVGYPLPNFSHFRATDIWMSASDSNQEVYSGWMGRYLNNEYPNFPNGYPNNNMKDPLAIQIGSITSLTLQGPMVSMGMSISNPTNFYNLLTGVMDPAPNNYAGKELSYVRTVANQTNQYATVIKDAANRVTQQATYPTNNTLADQLKIVARLIKGGLKTKVYMVSIGGFDTHSVQVNSADTSTGTHATLLGRVSDAIAAFQKDLAYLQIEEKVIGMTFSEFGRRIKSNGSIGTDHGSSAPVFLFGSRIKKGVLGNSPAVPTNTTVNDNIPFQYDFRSIYATILEKWFCIPKADVNTIMLKNFQSLPLLDFGSCANINDVNSLSGEKWVSNYPNPFTTTTRITFKTRGGHTLIQILDATGKLIAKPVERVYEEEGVYTADYDGTALPSGTYYVRFQNLEVQQVRPMVKMR